MLNLARLWARLAGLCVAATVLVAATQFLSLGFETEPLINADKLATLTDWIRRPPQAGAGILAAVAIIVTGLAALIGGLWPNQTPTVIVTRRRGGWTRVDRSSLQGAIERRLESLDRRSDLRTSVHRSGRVDIDVTSIDAAVDGPAAKVRDAFLELCDQRRLPCKTGTITVQGRPPTTNRRHTIQ